MESSLKNELKVGLFVLLGIIGFCVSILLLGGDQMFFKNRYQLRVLLPQVQGLAPGSVVSLSGVNVGNIRELHFVNEAREIEVIMDIDRSIQPRITEGTQASVKTQGALGDKFIFLEPGPLGAPVIPEGSLVATATSADLLDVITAKGAELAQISEVIKEVNTLLRTLNSENRTGKLMDNLIRGSDQFNTLMSQGHQSMDRLANVVRKLDEGQGTLGRLINDPALYSRIMSFVGDAPRNKFLKPLIRDTIETNEEAAKK